MPRRVVRTTPQRIVSVMLEPLAKMQLDAICQIRGMTIKTTLSRLIEWFGTLDKTEQSTLLGLVEKDETGSLVARLALRNPSAEPKTRAKSRSQSGGEGTAK